jgi:uncharacterized membrane protein
MQNLKQLSMKPLKAIPTSTAIFLLVVALIGFVDAGYLTVEHYQGRVPPCSITAGCEQVLTSSYAVVAGIPVSLAGLIYYFLILVGVFAYLESKNTTLLKVAMLLTIVGLLASLWFVYIQVFIIHSYCLYCLGSAFTSTILFVTAMEVFARYQD